MAASKQILFVLSSHDKMLSGKPTGFYLPEAAHPYYVVKAAGYTPVFASPKGGKAPLDPSSVEGFKEDKESVEWLNDAAIQKEVANTLKLSDVNEKDYAAIFYVGGHGPIFDLTSNPESHRLIREFWAAGKIVSLVCHAPCCLIEVKDSNGELFVKGKKVTCFTDSEERAAGLVEEIPFLVETRLREAGADFIANRQDWAEEVVVDGNLITGGNPASATKLGKVLVEKLQKQQ